jgi:rifampicin phosphotransferase
MAHVVAQDAATRVDEVGGKAAALAHLARHGFAPPAFFVIRADAFDGGGLIDGLAGALAALGPGPFAVRSSARAEDGTRHSHAGQFATHLNVPPGGVAEAARAVWASGFGQGVAAYRALGPGGPAEGPAVIVQRMIDARAAGVAFSADPVSGRRDIVVISAIAGLGERLVSGEADGEDWTVTETPVCAGTPAILTVAEAAAIAALARRAETAFGAPQDVEWAIDAAGLHILQSRPITTPLLPPPTPDMALTIFDNSNIVESYPGLVSPLTYSFAVHVYARVYRAFVALLGVPERSIAAHAAVFDNMLGRIDGRVYYNLVNWYRALALLPGFALNRAHMETMMGVDVPMPAEVTDRIGPPPATGAARLSEYLRLARAGAGLIWQALLLARTRRRFHDRLNAALDVGIDPDRAGPTELAAEYRTIEATLLDRWDAPLVNDFLCMVAFGASRNLMARWLGPAGLTLHNDVMIGQGDIVSAEPARRIARMGRMLRAAGLADALAARGLAALAAAPELQREVAAYLDRFGDRCTEELKLESLTLRDDPSSLIAAILASAARGTDAARAAPPAPDWRALFRNPVRRAVARAVLGWTRARVRDRENLRFERTRVFGHARRIFLGLGREFAARGLIEAPRDIFLLTKSEVLGAVEGSGLSADLKSLVALRRAEAAAAALRPDPPERIAVRGPAIAPVWAETAAPRDAALQRAGTGCSAGRVTATARVIRDPRTQSLAAGEVLVARHTDPGWIAVFSNASAIVVERGSLLSHSAIVARELGIPCVVGLKGATGWIADGETVTVDGATGEVERHGGAI